MATLNTTLGLYMTNFWPGTDLTSFHDGQCYGNITLCLNNQLYCTIQTCDLTLAQMRYRPSLGGNALFAAIFGLCILAQLVQGIRYKTWAFMGAAIFGLALEVVGYVGRLMLYNDPFNNNDFLIYLVCLTIAPALLSGSIYLCLARIVVVYGENLSRFKPRTYTFTFCSCDFFSLLLQAIGGAIASIATEYSLQKTGINIMIAGLVCQVASLFIFATACADFAFRAYRHPQSWNTAHSSLYSSKLWRAFLVGLAVATLTIFVRSCYRVAELNAGFNGPLANNQVTFTILEATMVSVAALCLTILHPGLCFKGMWSQANFKIRTSKGKKGMDTLDSFSEDVEGAQRQKTPAIEMVRPSNNGSS